MFDIRHICHLEAAQNTVFHVLSSTEGLRQWWTPQTDGEPDLHGYLIFKFGGKYRNKMRVTAFERNSLIEWTVVESVPEWMDTKIRFQLDRNEDRTRMRFSHTGYKIQDDFFAQCNYSWAKYLRSIRMLVEHGKGDPYDINNPLD